MSSATLEGMVISAIVGAAIDSGKWKTDWAKAATMVQEQKNAAKTEDE